MPCRAFSVYFGRPLYSVFVQQSAVNDIFLFFNFVYVFHRLNNFFTGLDDKSPLKWNIYYSQLKLASKFGLTDKIETQLKQVSMKVKM